MQKHVVLAWINNFLTV